MALFFKGLGITVDVCLWVIFLVVGYILGDLTGFFIFTCFFLGGITIIGVLMLAYRVMEFLYVRRSEISFNHASQRDRQ
jgi:hypothetical protein